MNDYIKRDDAQKITAEWLSGYINDDERNVIEHIDVDLGELPPADVRENVRGEWIEKYYESNETGETVFHGMIMCSACGHIPKVGWLSNFCPNCGAQMMRGES